MCWHALGKFAIIEQKMPPHKEVYFETAPLSAIVVNGSNGNDKPGTEAAAAAARAWDCLGLPTGRDAARMQLIGVIGNDEDSAQLSLMMLISKVQVRGYCVVNNIYPGR